MARFNFSVFALFMLLGLLTNAMPVKRADADTGNALSNSDASEVAYESLMSAADMFKDMDQDDNDNVAVPKPAKSNQSDSTKDKPSQTQAQASKSQPSPSHLATPSSKPAPAREAEAAPSPSSNHKSEDNPFASLPLVGGLLGGAGLPI